jgi:glycosyltransferase involved in cell wall biosynthesis
MRIALVLPGFSAYAADWAIPALQQLALSLHEQHEVIVFSQRYPARGQYRLNGIDHMATGGNQRFGLPSLKIWLQSCAAVVRQHRHTPFDVVHAFWADEAGFSAVLAGTIIRRPVVVSIGGGELTHLPDIAYGAQRFLVRRLTTRVALKRADRVTAGSTYQLNICRAFGVTESTLRWAPLGVDTNLFQPGPDSGREIPPAVAQAASLLPVKNQALLLEIVTQAREKLPELTLHLAGDGPNQEPLQQLAYQLDLSQNIVWHKRVPYQRMPAFYHEAAIYLQSSYHESQGMAVLEAMACGLPAAGTAVGVLPDVSSLLLRRSSQKLATQIVDLIKNNDHYRMLSEQARMIAVEKYSLPVTTRNYLDIYADIL